MQIIVKNIATEYKDEGEGSVVLLLHGWQDNLHTFDALVPLISTKRRIIRLDLPGFGNTEMPPNEWNLDDYVEFVAEFVGKLNIAVDAVVGHSFGGRIIIKGVASENIRTEKIVLIASAGVAERHTVRRSAIKSATKLGSAIAWLPPFIFFRRQLRSKLYESIGSDYLRAGSMKNIYLNIIKEDLSSSARQIKCPALLIWGDRDATTPMREGLRFSKLIEKSTLKVIEGAGHFVHQQQARKVAAYINEFIT